MAELGNRSLDVGEPMPRARRYDLSLLEINMIDRIPSLFVFCICQIVFDQLLQPALWGNLGLNKISLFGLSTK